jgi:hypothetical protein
MFNSLPANVVVDSFVVDVYYVATAYFQFERKPCRASALQTSPT